MTILAQILGVIFLTKKAINFRSQTGLKRPQTGLLTIARYRTSRLCGRYSPETTEFHNHSDDDDEIRQRRIAGCAAT